MIRFFLIVLAAVAAKAGDISESVKLRLSPRIAHGVVANIAHFPYMASLEVADVASCGASIIRADVVLTAAHCTSQNPAMILRVRAGTAISEAQQGGTMQWRWVARYVNHPEHKKAAYGDKDIAVVWLKKPFILNGFVNVINLANSDFTGQEAVILGWGKDENFKDSQRLKRGSVLVISNKECAQKSLPGYKITQNMVCTKSTSAKQVICKNDSGGPLVIHSDQNPKNDVLIGVVSYGRVVTRNNRKFCDPDAPVVYARIQNLRKWILCDQLKICERS